MNLPFFPKLIGDLYLPGPGDNNFFLCFLKISSIWIVFIFYLLTPNEQCWLGPFNTFLPYPSESFPKNPLISYQPGAGRESAWFNILSKSTNLCYFEKARPWVFVLSPLPLKRSFLSYITSSSKLLSFMNRGDLGKLYFYLEVEVFIVKVLFIISLLFIIWVALDECLLIIIN